MINTFKRKLNGDLAVVMEERFDVVDTANSEALEVIVKAVHYVSEVHGYVRRLESQLEVLNSKVEDVVDMTTETNAVVLESRTTNHIGKKPEILKEITQEVGKLTVKEIRDLINRAANRQQKGYMRIYSKVSDITGVDIYEVGKVSITEDDGLGFTNNNATYINTLFKKGVHEQAAAIALDIIRNK